MTELDRLDRDAVLAELEWKRVFLETAVDGIVTIDATGTVETFNPAAERMFGYAASEVIGSNVKLLMPAPYRDEHDAYLERFLSTDARKIIGIGREVEALRKDGSTFPIHLSVAEQHLGGQRKFTGVLHDLTVQREAQQRALDTARIVETSLNEVYIFDAASLRFLQVNRGARANLGYAMEELEHMTPLDIKPDLTLPEFEDLLEPLRARRDPTVVFTTQHARKDGTTYPVEVHVQLSGFAGKPAFVAIIADVTERERMQAELLHSQKLEAIGQLAGALAHDFNNLLMGVTSGCRMVARLLDEDSPARGLLDEIQKEALSGAGITRQLLDFSRKRTYEAQPCDLHALVAESGTLLRSLLGETIELVIAVDAKGGTIHADPAKLSQIVMNLVVNARDAMPREGGRLELTVANQTSKGSHPGQERGPIVALTVTDNGCGMDDDTQRRIFEPFFTTKEPGKGTGLGLSTVYGLTREAGGIVEVQSEPGAGTTFRFEFPRFDEADDCGVLAKPDAAPTAAARILLVEDAPLVRAGIRAMLLDHDYHVVDAADPKAALERLGDSERAFDVLLSDILMPGMSGPELAKRVLRSSPETRVLFMSAFSDEALVEQGRVQTDDVVLEKPFAEETLITKLEELLGRDATPGGQA